MKKTIIFLLVLTMTVAFAACKTLPQESSSADVNTSSALTSIYSELESSEETTSTDESSSATTSSTSQEQTSTVAPPPPSSSTKKFVKPADPDTGVSWDGVSPIVYTYPDGTTGTEKKVGATYEQVPGIITTVDVPTEKNHEYDGLCNYCGKEEGEGTNGTCLRYWTGGDHTCQNCGEIVPINTCHACG